jgi:hypothetical protein
MIFDRIGLSMVQFTSPLVFSGKGLLEMEVVS